MLWEWLYPGGGGVLCGFAGIWHCCREERQKTLDGRSPSFSKTGIITHWAAETIWWNAGPVLRKRTLIRKLTLCQFTGILSAVIVPPGLRSRLPGSTLCLHPSFQP